MPNYEEKTAREILIGVNDNAIDAESIWINRRQAEDVYEQSRARVEAEKEKYRELQRELWETRQKLTTAEKRLKALFLTGAEY